jgi:uncharacterized cupredoxin-like copper-binding protein
MIGRGIGLFVLAGGLLVPAVLAACNSPAGAAGGTQQVTVQATEFRFDPATVTVKAGAPVQLTLRNMGTQVHDWTVDNLGGQKVQVVAQPGQSSNITFTPTQPGTYQVYCDQPGHKDAGMVGQLIVQ